VRRLVQKTSPQRDGETEEAWDRRIRSQYVDVCRFLLPAASLANVGVTANGRVLENAIRKWRSSPLAEVREIGESVKAVAIGEIPTLVKYAEPVEYLIETSTELSALASCHSPNGRGNGVRDRCVLVDYDEHGEEQVLASVLYRFGNLSYSDALGMVKSASAEALANALLKRLGRYDLPLRELEHTSYTFDLIMDQGAYAEFKRHRMMTQTPQRLTCALGYAVPRRFIEAGFEDEYRLAMDAAGALWQKLAAWNADVAQYVVPNGYNRRVLATFNLREAYAFCQLRAAANAHFSIRRVAQRVAEEIGKVHPLLAKYMNLQEETWQRIENDYFTAME
jgi:thymidylate synthase ThyX